MFKANTLNLRLVIIATMGFLMLIPVSRVSEIVYERQSLYNSVLDGIANIWGQPQSLQAPVWVIPYTEKIIEQENITDKDGNSKTVNRTRYNQRQAIALPQQLAIQAQLHEQERQRGIYHALVYTAEVELTGQFLPPDINSLSNHIEQIHWDKSFIAIGLSDTKAINQVSKLQWNSRPQTLSPSTRLPDILPQGFHALLSDFAPQSQYNFQLKLNFNGSTGLRFAPLGETSQISLQSTWPHPSFQGDILPAKHDIHAQGFQAQWSIPHLARSYPQLWQLPDDKHNLTAFAVGVDLFEPVSLYSQVMRAVKYAVLFIFLTFITFLIFELSLALKMHYVQYGLIGAALCLFYLLLLSLAEHIAFLSAYIIASAVTIGLITAYTLSVLKKIGRSLLVMFMLTSLYTVLYSLLQLEDYALLVGTSLLLLVIALLMYVTRNISQRAFAQNP